MIKAVIADDIQILRQGLRAILEQDKDIRVVGLAADGREAWQLCRKHRPDVVLMDMRMPEYDGSYGVTRIMDELTYLASDCVRRFDEARKDSFEDREDLLRKLLMYEVSDSGPLKEMEDDKVIQSVKAVCAGIRVFGGSVFEGMRRQMASGKTKADMAGDLTPRERDIMRLVARGMDNREIAGALFLAEGTVRNNISRLLEKLKLKDRTQLAVFAVKHNLDE